MASEVTKIFVHIFQVKLIKNLLYTECAILIAMTKQAQTSKIGDVAMVYRITEFLKMFMFQKN